VRIRQSHFKPVPLILVVDRAVSKSGKEKSLKANRTTSDMIGQLFFEFELKIRAWPCFDIFQLA
jgi:hypothetical protein